MKFLISLILIFIILIVNSENIVLSSEFKCGNSSCITGLQTCKTEYLIQHCVFKVEELTIIQNVMKRWNDSDSNPSIQVSVDIVNQTNKVIKNIVIAAAGHLSYDQMWGVSKCSYTDTISIINFPQYLNLKPSQIHNFGYIAKGNSTSHLYVQRIVIV